jgi:hypothetical protein
MTVKKTGDVFSLKGYGDRDQTDKKIGTFEERDNGDIRVSLDWLPWDGGQMLMRPNKIEVVKVKTLLEPN